MRYLTELKTYEASIMTRSNERKALKFGELAGLKLTTHALSGQSAYLLWSILLVLLHVIEVFILARFHYIYFPPKGLTLLRALSSLSLLGVIAALSERILRHSTNLKIAFDLNDRIKQVRISAHSLFIIGTTFSLLLGCYLAFVSKLELATPLAFRAVLISSLLTLPFDITNSYLLYSASFTNAPPIRNNLRVIAIISYLIGLLSLALDASFFYLIFAFLPRLILTKALWTNISGNNLLNLFKLDKFKLPPTKLVYSYFLLELTLFITFSRLSRYDPNIGLLLFFTHKALHLITILLLKDALRWCSELIISIQIKDINYFKSLNLKALHLTFSYVGLSLLVIPIYILQKSVVYWLSPTGTYVVFDYFILITLALLLLSSRAVATLGIVTTCIVSRLYKGLLQYLGLALIISSSIFFLTPLAVQNFSFTAVAFCLIALDGVISIIIFRIAAHQIRGEYDKKRVTISHLIQNIKGASLNNTHTAILVRLSKEQRGPIPQVIEQLNPVIWNRRALICIVSDEKLSTVKVQIATCLAGLIEYIEDVKLGDDINELSSKLYKLGVKYPPKTYTDTQCNDRIEVRIEKNSSWDLSKLSMELRLIIRRYLKELSLDPLSPCVWQSDKYRGLYHLNKNGAPQTVIYCPSHDRKFINALRYRAWLDNFKDAINAA